MFRVHASSRIARRPELRSLAASGTRPWPGTVASAVLTMLAACQSGASAQPEAESALAEISAQIGDAACSADSQCRTLAIGKKPCGGPESYVAWSALRSDAA